MAYGWRGLSCLGLAYIGHGLAMNYSSRVHEPIIGAYLRKYRNNITSDPFEIRDEKKSYFYIDTSQYMKYSNADLGDQYHMSHGPQPEGEDSANSW